jgi:hypothetical protein
MTHEIINYYTGKRVTQKLFNTHYEAMLYQKQATKDEVITKVPLYIIRPVDALTN